MRWKDEKGQATVEFALILPIFILLVFGIIDFGWLFYNKIQVNNASREGARYAVVHWDEEDYITNTETKVTAVLSGASVTVTDHVESVTVTVSKNVDVLTGVTSVFVGDRVNLKSNCTMRKE
ncbi:MAG: TadE/TadG family type IV pilus assembly protein [Lachnospiraceae bacterium]